MISPISYGSGSVRRPGHPDLISSYVEQQLRQMRNIRPLALRLAGDRWARQLGCARLHHEGVVERVPRTIHVGRGRLLGLVPHVVADEAPGNAELQDRKSTRLNSS